MKIFVSQSGWVEIHDPNNKETHLHGFYNLKDVKEGTGFIVVQLKNYSKPRKMRYLEN